MVFSGVLVLLFIILPADVLCFEERQFDAEQLVVPYFMINNYRVWGATALMLSDFAARIRAYQAQTTIR